MTEEAIEIVDLESRLKNDDGSLRDQLVTSFNNEADAIKSRMDAGLAPDEFEQTQRVHNALATAATVVTNYWNMSHPEIQ